jgi:hypothetical protein
MVCHWRANFEDSVRKRSCLLRSCCCAKAMIFGLRRANRAAHRSCGATSADIRWHHAICAEAAQPFRHIAAGGAKCRRAPSGRWGALRDDTARCGAARSATTTRWSCRSPRPRCCRRCRRRGGEGGDRQGTGIRGVRRRAMPISNVRCPVKTAGPLSAEAANLV